MNRRKIEQECRALFPPLRPCKVRWIEAEFPVGETWNGIFCPGGELGSRASDTIILNLHYIQDKDEHGKHGTEAFARGVLIHELIHLEQWTAGNNPSHGIYFKRRRAELRTKTGLYIP